MIVLFLMLEFLFEAAEENERVDWEGRMSSWIISSGASFVMLSFRFWILLHFSLKSMWRSKLFSFGHNSPQKSHLQSDLRHEASLLALRLS